MSKPDNILMRVRLDETDDKGKQQLMKVRGRVRETVGGRQKFVRVQGYGLSTHPPKGSQGIAVMLNGNPDQTLFVGIEHPDHRPTDLAEGETKLYDTNGQYVHIKADGTLVIHGGGCTITMAGGVITLDGNVKLGGASASRELALKGSIDSAGDVEVANLSTKVTAI